MREFFAEKGGELVNEAVMRIYLRSGFGSYVGY
jgi:hypothetical protein